MNPSVSSFFFVFSFTHSVASTWSVGPCSSSSAAVAAAASAVGAAAAAFSGSEDAIEAINRRANSVDESREKVIADSFSFSRFFFVQAIKETIEEKRCSVALPSPWREPSATPPGREDIAVAAAAAASQQQPQQEQRRRAGGLTLLLLQRHLTAFDRRRRRPRRRPLLRRLLPPPTPRASSTMCLL